MSSGVLSDGVCSEWGYAHWCLFRLPMAVITGAGMEYQHLSHQYSLTFLELRFSYDDKVPISYTLKCLQ